MGDILQATSSPASYLFIPAYHSYLVFLWYYTTFKYDLYPP